MGSLRGLTSAVSGVRAHSTQPNKRTSVTTQAQASSVAFCYEACWTLLCTTHKLWAAASFAEWSSPGNNGCRPIGSHRQGGGGACFFRIHSNGIKNEHSPRFDHTVFFADRAAVMITTGRCVMITICRVRHHCSSIHLTRQVSIHRMPVETDSECSPGALRPRVV